MKLALIGAGGARTPLLVNGLTRSDLPIREISLYDPDQARLARMADLARRHCRHIPLSSHARAEDAIAGADFVFISIRVGGIAARARDEATALEHGILGQETVGPGGFAKATRTVPHVVSYARLVQAHAPQAWIINFYQPRRHRHTGGADRHRRADHRHLRHADGAVRGGLPCTRPSLEQGARRLLSLNHLGWVREVYYRGEPQMHRLWSEPERLSKVYRSPLFATDLLRELRLLPTEYVYSQLYLRILRPQWHTLLPDTDRLPRSLRTALDQLEAEIHKLHQEAAFAA